VKITVYSNPENVKNSTIQNATVVWVDVLRFSSLVSLYFYHGVQAVYTSAEVLEAPKKVSHLKSSEILLSGSKNAQKYPGFHMAFSLLESRREKVKKKYISLVAPEAAGLKWVQNAKHVLLGSFLNLSAVYEQCLKNRRDVVIVEAGYHNSVSLPDHAFAGMMVDFFTSTVGGGIDLEFAETAVKARGAYRPWQGRLLELLKQSPEGKELIQAGLEKEIDFCCKVNKVYEVPFLKDSKDPVFICADYSKNKKMEESGQKYKATTLSAKKGKAVKVKVPLFPKNPEHPIGAIVQNSIKSSPAPVALTTTKPKPLPPKNDKRRKAVLFPKKHKR
jgi:2-phosphosulfolactate phosphatase